MNDIQEVIALAKDYAKLKSYDAAISEMERAKNMIKAMLSKRSKLTQASKRRWQSMLEKSCEEIRIYSRLKVEQQHALKKSQSSIIGKCSNLSRRSQHVPPINEPQQPSINRLSTKKQINARRNANRRASANGDVSKSSFLEIAKERNHPNIDLIESIEQDIVKGSEKVLWSQIADLDNAKELLQEAIILPTYMPDLFKGIRRPWKGVLLYGPPGTGKTLLAKAVASECNTCFLNVSASTLSSKFRGESEKMVRLLFEIARYYAPSTIFFDEIDSLAGKRGGQNEHEASRRVKTELMIEMDGVDKKGDNHSELPRVIVIAASNCPWDLDEAIRRRFEKRIYIPLPTSFGRKELFRIGLSEANYQEDSVDFDELAERTEGYSGADITNIIRDSAMMSLRKAINDAKQFGLSGRSMCEYIERNTDAVRTTQITQDDLLNAINKIGKSVGYAQLHNFSKWEDEFGSS